MALITTKDRMRSEANLRPCIVCVTTGKSLITAFADNRCEYYKKRPVIGNSNQYVRCTNGLCKEHDSNVTIMDVTYKHICPQCFFELVILPGQLKETESKFF